MSLIAELNERKKKQQETNASTSKTGGLMAEVNLRKKYQSLPVDSVDDKYISTFVSDANSFLGGVGENSLSYTDATGRLSDLNMRYDTIQGWLYKNKDKLDEETYTGISSSFDSLRSGLDSIRDYYGQFESEDEYNSWYNRESFIKNYLSNPEKAVQGEYDDSWLQEAQYRAEAQTVLGSEDFEQYSTAGEAKGADPANWWKKSENLIAQMRNDPDLLADYEQSARESDGALGAGIAKNTLLDQIPYKAAKYMTDDEYAVYNYYVGKGETEKAEAYLSSIEDYLNRRQAGQMVSDVQGNRLKEIAFAFEAGMNQFISGVGGLDNWIMGTDADPTSAVQYANAEIGAGLDGGWKVAYDLTSTTANMLPSILVSTIPVVGQAAGIASMGLSATGNAYSEMRKLGYDEGASQNYAFLVGASEATLQYALGGISKLGGKLSGNVISNVVNKIDNALARVAIQLGGNMLSEGAEEAVQSILEPIFKSLTTGESFEGIDIEEVVYSGLLGMLSAGVLEGGSTVVGNAVAGSEAKQFYGNGAELVTEALEIDPNNTYAQKLKAKLDSGKKLSGLELNRLVEMNESGMVANDTTAIREAAVRRLTELGEEGDVDAIATALAKQASGERLSLSERSLIRNSLNGQRVANELNTKNIESGEYTSAWAEKIGTDRINAEEYGRMLAELEAEDAAISMQEAAKAPAATVQESQTVETPTEVSEEFTDEAEAVDLTESAPAAEIAAEGEYEAVEPPTPIQTESEAAPAASLEEASKKYGAQAGAMVHSYIAGQDVARYDAAYRIAYEMGMSGVSLSYVKNSEATAYLSETQRELAYEAGKAASDTAAQEQDAKNKAAANGKTGRRKGTVKGEGVTIADLKESFNDTQGTAYKLLSTYAEATGIDIVLFKSETNADGAFEGAQGRFKWSEDTVYIDVNAGLANKGSVNDLAKYTMLRTFSHEFTHFIEKWNPVQYNEFRRVVFDTMTERGENVDGLIQQKQAQDANGSMTYDLASREVVAEAMTDILPDANFVQELAENHKTIFNKLLEKLQEFVSELKAYFRTIQRGRASTREAKVLMEQVGESVQYVESIVKLFDRVAVEAVDNYQRTVATEAPVEEKNTVQSDSVTPTTQKHDTMEAEAPAKVAETENIITEEVESNVENADNRGAVSQPDTDRSGDSRLLDEVEAEDVPRDGEGGDSVGDPVQRGQEAGRSGLQADNGTGNVGGHGDGSRESADLRRDDGLTEESSEPATDTNVGDTADNAAAEVKALASGSPLIMEQVQLDTDIKKLESLYRSHVSAVRAAKEKLSRDKGSITTLEAFIEDGKADMAARKDTYSEGKFSITVGKMKYTDKKEAGIALMAEATAKANEQDYTTVATFAGFELRVIKTHEGIKGIIQGEQGYPFNTYPNNTTFMINHLISAVEGMENRVKIWEQSLIDTRADMAEQKKMMAEPFAKQAELDQKRTRYNEVMAILNPKEEQSLDSVDEETVQEQSRAYLGEHKYSYEWFASKPDMVVIDVDDSVKHTRTDIVSLALKNAASVGYTNQNGNAVVRVKDIDTDVIVPKRSLVHGLDRRKDTQAPVLVRIGDVLKNAIRVNELIPRADEIKNAYVLIGAAKNQEGNLYIASFVVNKYSNEVSKIDVLYSANAKKESAALLPKITDKSATPTDSDISIAQLLEFVNRYFPDILPEDVLRHFGHETRPDGTLGRDTLYQQRTNTLTDREVLSMAAERLEGSPDLTDGERDALRIFQDRLNTLQLLHEERAEQGRLYKEQQFGAKVDRAAAAETLNRMHILDDKIKAANDAVLSVENKAVLRQVLGKARKVVEEQERQHGKEILDRWRDRTKNAATIKKYRERIQTDVAELSNWILKPNNKDIVKHVPDALKNTVIPFLKAINFTSKQQLRGGGATKADQEFMNRLNALNGALKENMDVNGLYSGYNDLPPNFMENLQIFINSVQAIVNQHSGEFVINRMTGDELHELSKVVRTLKQYITQINRFHANAMFQHVYEAGDNTIDSLKVMKSNDGQANGVSNFLFWQQMRPAYAFERFGEGGKAIYDGLRRGQAQLAFNTHQIVDFTKKVYTEKEVKAWEKEIKEIRLGGDIVKMRISHMMSFYELSKQTDSLRHILKGGVRVATYTERGKKISDNGHIVTEADIQTIMNALTPRQKEVADSLQKYMAEQGGAWGNYVSVKRFGEELFGNPQYFPINSDGRHLQSTADENPSAASLYVLLNMSFTKSRNEKASNRIVLYSIFDVFSNHMASMAQYNAMALPVLDALKWFNYQQKAETPDGERVMVGSVREQMARVYGVPEESRPGSGRQGYAEAFVANILKAFNGTEAQGVPTDTFGMNATRRYNMAQVAYNFRVVVQQPLAMTRAALLIDYGSIAKGLKLSPKAIKNNVAEMRKYSGIATWKSLGFYDVNISRGLSDIIKHKSTIGDKINDVGMWGAEKADILTWSAIWSACKEEVIKKQGLKPANAGFYPAVTKLFEDVIYKTQVVDSILTKNEYMRSKGFFARAIGSFMSEPTTTASMVLNAYDKYHMDMQKGMSRQQAWKKNGKLIGRTVYVYAITQTLLAAVTAVMDAGRDDDEYENFLEKWLEAFKGNLLDELLPFNKLPILSDFYDLAKELLSVFGVDTYGNPPQSVFMQWYDSLIKGVEIIYDKITNEDTDYTWYGGVYKLLQAVSGMTGLPMAAATREVVTIWNNTVGVMAPSYKVKTYDSGEMNEIKYAYADGYLTDEEAVGLLLEKGLVDTEDEAYFTVAGWEAGEGYSRYDAIYDAVLNGEDFDAAMEELISHGYDEEDVLKQVKGQIGRWYYDEESSVRISKQQAISMLKKYTDMDSEEITKAVNKWSSKVVTGIAYDDIDDEFMEGNISASRATEMYIRYGSMTQEEASKKVAVLAFVKEHPECEGISYAAVEGYTVYCEPVGVDASVFYDVWQYNSDTKADVDENGESISGSKKVKVLDYIHSLDLSARQKDSLYFAFGWAESRLYEAPWH